ncbi:MAG: hypothetical protein M1835_002750 [Candelina submexicana]|nr:MAG: hypothetical protein M1835_002750 [Candelina submexicana]
MGLRIFDPEAQQPKVKTDPTASTRSSIRRQPPTRRLRGLPSPRSSYRVASGSDISAALGRRSPRSLSDIVESDLANVAQDDARANSDFETDATNARASASNRRRLENGRALLRDALSYERPSQRMRAPLSGLTYSMGAPLPPVPESRDYVRAGSEISRRASGRSASPTLRYMPTPPYTSGDAASTRRSRSPSLVSSSLTPRFAPAYPTAEPTTSSARRHFGAWEPRFDSRRNISRTPSVNDLPHLQRMISRSSADGPPLGDIEHSHASRRLMANLDGLGDRERSFSPDDDAWDTLLTTITPDSHLPSTDSSFTSASASASASSLASNSTSSSASLLTAPTSSSDNLEPFPICDNSSDSEGSDTDTIGFEVGEPLTRSNLPERDSHRYSPNVHGRGREAGRLVEDYFIGARRRAMERADGDPELQQVHSILERLARREDIPDEWWAAAGLSRNLGRRSDRPDREHL